MQSLNDPRDQAQESGQIIVLFAMALMAIVAIAGLVIDGGRAFAQRRDEQNVADVASVAGATAYLNASGTFSERVPIAEAAARSVAGTNGYTEGTDGAIVSVTVSATFGGATVQVDVTKPQSNTFARLLGQDAWHVSATATAMASDSPNAADGAMPLLFNEELFETNDDGYSPNQELEFSAPDVGNEDVPQEADQFNWTIYCTAQGNPCNANSEGVRQIIEGSGESTVIDLNDDIGPLNAGSHTTLFDALAAQEGTEFPVAIVNDEGEMIGWGWFHLTDSIGGSDKKIRGHFVSPVNPPPLYVVPGGGSGTSSVGAYILRLID